MAARPPLPRPTTVSFDVPGIQSSRSRLADVAREVNKNFSPDTIACLQPRGTKTYLLSFKTQAHALQSIDEGLLIFGQRIQTAQVSGGITAVTITDAPFELTDDEIKTAFSFYGDVRRVETLRFPPELGSYRTGDRKVFLSMKKPVPNILNVAGFEVVCWYREVKKLCRRCGGTGHIAADCPAAAPPGPRRCSNCGNRWHAADACPGCPTCRTEAHGPDSCPARPVKEETPATDEDTAAPEEESALTEDESIVTEAESTDTEDDTGPAPEERPAATGTDTAPAPQERPATTASAPTPAQPTTTHDTDDVLKRKTTTPPAASSQHQPRKPRKKQKRRTFANHYRYCAYDPQNSFKCTVHPDCDFSQS